MSSSPAGNAGASAPASTPANAPALTQPSSATAAEASIGIAALAPNTTGGETPAIEVDQDDADSTYAETGSIDDTTTLRSSIMHYKWEHGRRYHAYQDGTYWGPNDEAQQEAEDLMHEMFRIVLDGKLNLAPVPEDLHYVLDVGCGTGMWAMDFADEHPSAEVIGVDLSPIQPNAVPPNCRFEVDDINNDWTYSKDKFDFVHIRWMSGCVPDWAAFHQKVLKHLKPGGWVEQAELSAIISSDDGTVLPDSALAEWWEILDKVGAKTGKTFGAAETCGDIVRSAGYVNVHEHAMKIPIGTWPRDPRLKEWGRWNRTFLTQGAEGFALRGLTAVLGWTYEQAQLYLVQLRKDLGNPRIHSYIYLRIVYGQKQKSDVSED